MLKVTNWKDLPIPPILLNQVKQHLLSPFDNEDEAQSTWAELEGELYLRLSSNEGADYILKNGYHYNPLSPS